MMALITRGLILLGAGVALPVAWRVGHLTSASAEGPGTPGSSVQSAEASPPLSADSLATFPARDPFRLTRRPAPVAYDPLVGMPAPDQPPPARPPLQLTGISVGTEASAIVEGFPGTDGPQVVRPGQVVAGLRVRRITGTTVVIEGADTTWSLRIREPWH